MTKINTKTLVTLAMLCAIAYAVAAIFTHFPSPFAFSFLRYDPKDVIILFGGFLYGPFYALIMSVIVALLELVTVSPEGPWGFIMNVSGTVVLTCTASFIYHRRQTLSGVITGLTVGIALTTGTMALLNYLIIPIYQGAPREVVAKLLLPVIVPFNLFKSIANAVLVMTLFKPLTTALCRAKLIQPVIMGQRSTLAKWIFVLVGLAAVVVLFLLYGEFSLPEST